MSLKEKYAQINEELPLNHHYGKPLLFLRGEKSDYIQIDDVSDINKLFPKARLVTAKNAGHWVHVDAKEDFVQAVLDFLSF
jgi:esterase